MQAALEALPPEQQQAAEQQLKTLEEQAGLQSGGPDMEEVLKEWEPMLQAIAAVAKGDDGPRAEVERFLPQLEENGCKISAAVQAVWAGERDADKLTAGLDDFDALLVRRILELLV
ncbi:MAG: hypothetical protein GY862_00870 [Gammaproteobacteria bacterium]|nr:hypothetical protein [Gammaproteobacteria bacterium]